MSVDEQATFDVTYKPSAIQKSQAHIKLSVVDNEYEDSVIYLVGEGYQDEISLDNIHSVIVDPDPEKLDGTMTDDDVEGKKLLFPSPSFFISNHRKLRVTRSCVTRIITQLE